MNNNRPIKSIILAAGKGTRMNSELPKVLHKIQGLTLLERVINQTLKVEQMSEALVITGHKSEMVNNYLNEVYDNNIFQAILQSPQLGTGDAVSKAKDTLKDFNGDVLILCGDTPLLTGKLLNEFVKSHHEAESDLTVLSAILDDPTGYGRIIKKGDNLEKIVEEKDANEEQKLVMEVNTGVYCLNWQKIAPAFSSLTSQNSQNEYYLTDIIEWAVKQGLKTRTHVLEDNQQTFGINSREDLAKATEILNKSTIKSLLEKGITIHMPQTVSISPETTIGKDTIIYPNVCIEGTNIIGENNIIGPNTFIKGNVKTYENVSIIQSQLSDTTISKGCTIGPFAQLRDGAEIQENVRIGNFVEIKKSTIDKNTNAAHLSYIGDAQLGKDVNIGAGTITANYNALTKQKNKTTIKDGAKTGSNSVLVAPVEIGENANIAAGSVITKNVPDNSLAITRVKQTILKDWVLKQIKRIKGSNA